MLTTERNGVYVALKPCGCVGLLGAEDYAKEKGPSRDLAKALTQGYRIELWSSERFKTEKIVSAHRCPHKGDTEQRPLSREVPV
jgi:hypothetical protein